MIRFDTLSNREIQRSWPKNAGQQRPKITEHGALFALSFADDEKRIVSDCQGKWNLLRESCIRFELEVQRPVYLLEATLYFRSGTGWYSHAFTLNGPGRHVLSVPLSDFKTEGAPSGWGDISTVRFAFWPRAKGQTVIRPIRLDAIRAPVVIVDGSADSPVSERFLCRTTAKRMRDLMQHTGIPFAVTGTRELDRLLEQAPPKTLILPYLPSPSREVLASLNHHLKRGGKFIVYQSQSPTLAQWLGVRLGGSLSSRSVGKFDQISFTDSNLGFPRKIFQHAWSFREVHPTSGTTQILARWQNQAGKTYSTPAVLKHPNGIWLSHVWRSADSAGKIQTLTAMLGALDTRNWKWAADALYKRMNPRAFQVKYGSFNPGHKPSMRMRQAAEQVYQQAMTAQKAGQFRSAWEAFSRVQPLMFRALASGRNSWKPPLRGIWDQNGTGFSVGSWEETCRAVKEAGFNAVFNYVGSPGRANYPSRSVPPSKTFLLHGDQIEQFSRAAKRYGLQRHFWKICWKLNSADPAFDKKMASQNRLMQDANGNNLPWLTPSDPRNVEMEIQSMLELLRNYQPEGMHLDYMRYPGPEADFGPAARNAFEARHGRVTNWPADVASGSRKQEFLQFKQEELHRAMRKIRSRLQKEFPDVTLSIAVWGAYPDCSISKAQDWPVWGKEDLADLLIPMNYTANAYQLNGWIQNQIRQPGCRDKIVPGLGLISTECELDPAELLQQMELCRSLGLPGTVLYRLDSSLPNRLFPMLQAGVFNYE